MCSLTSKTCFEETRWLFIFLGFKLVALQDVLIDHMSITKKHIGYKKERKVRVRVLHNHFIFS